MRQPLAVLDELEAGVARVEAPPQEQRRREGDERHAERDVAHGPLAFGAVTAPAGKQHQERAEQRQEDDCGEQHQRVKYQPRIKTTPTNRDAAYARIEPDCRRRIEELVPRTAEPTPLTAPSMSAASAPFQSTTVDSRLIGCTTTAS